MNVGAPIEPFVWSSIGESVDPPPKARVPDLGHHDEDLSEWRSRAPSVATMHSHVNRIERSPSSKGARTPRRFERNTGVIPMVLQREPSPTQAPASFWKGDLRRHLNQNNAALLGAAVAVGVSVITMAMVATVLEQVSSMSDRLRQQGI